MSIAALNWAWSQECPNASAKLVLLALADKANDDGECWPGLDHIAAMAGISTRQVSSHLGSLVDAGLIVVKRNRSSLGRLGKNVYHLKCTSGSTLPMDQRKSTSGSTLPVEPSTIGSPASSTIGSVLPVIKQPTKSNPKKTLATGKPSRKPDLIFEKLVDVCGLNLAELTKSARGPLNKAAAELREVGASPEGIEARARVYRQRWPDMELTPSSLAKHYAQLGAARKGQHRSVPKADECRDCGQKLQGHDDQLCMILAKAG